MAKTKFTVSTNINHKIFHDLEKYLKFCKDYGYTFDERDLYKDHSNTWRQYSKFLVGKPVKNMWEQDSVR